MRELVILLFLFGIPAIIAYAIWRVYSLTISPKARLRRLEKLRSSGAITLWHGDDADDERGADGRFAQP